MFGVEVVGDTQNRPGEIRTWLGDYHPHRLNLSDGQTATGGRVVSMVPSGIDVEVRANRIGDLTEPAALAADLHVALGMHELVDAHDRSDECASRARRNSSVQSPTVGAPCPSMAPEPTTTV